MFMKVADINTNQTPPLLLQPNQVYEEIREGRQRKSPPPFSSVKYIKPTETTDEYSSITAASSQRKVRNDFGRILSLGSENCNFRLHPFKNVVIVCQEMEIIFALVQLPFLFGSKQIKNQLYCTAVFSFNFTTSVCVISQI